MDIIDRSKTINIDFLTKSFLLCMSNLIIFFKKENKLLSQGDILGVKKILDKKYETLTKFQNIESQIQQYLYENTINDNEEIKKLLKNSRIKYNELKELMQENDILLRSNVEISERIIEIYNNSKVEQVINQFGYGSDGKITASQNLEKIMPSMNLDNKI